MSSEKSSSSDESGSVPRPTKRKLTLTQFTLLAFLLGIVTGLFFGDFCTPLEKVGTAYIGLLQMTVYPYIAISIISNIGRLTTEQVRRLARHGLYVLGVLWCIGLFILVVMPLALPDWHTAGFFSRAQLQKPPEINYLDLFIPKNPFASLSNGWVPAIVVFCVCVGIAFIQVENKQPLLVQLEVLTKALGQVNAMIVRLMPLGIFVITANAAGTLSLEELARLKAYLLSYTIAVLFLSFWVLPMLVVTITPFTYREVMEAAKQGLITGFVTGKLIVVLPLLIEGTRKLYERFPERSEEAGKETELLYPLIYPFPNLGKILTALFIPFAGWFLGQTLSPERYPGFLAAALLNSFGNVIVSIESLLNVMQLPSDMLQLFIVGGLYSSRIGEVLGVMHLVTFVLLTSSAGAGLLRIQIRRLLIYLGITLLLTAGMIAGMRLYLSQSVKDAEGKQAVLEKMELLRKVPEFRLLDTAEPNPVKLKPGQSYQDRILERGWIRVGYDQRNLPYSWLNREGHPVGFDVDMAHHLAIDLGVGLELVPIDRNELEDQMKRDCFDIVMSGVRGTLPNTKAFLLSDPYLTVTEALVVPDYRVKDLSDISRLKRAPKLRLAHVGELGPRFRYRLRSVLPNAKTTRIRRVEDYFTNEQEDYDGLLIDAESGSAWTIIYPGFKVVIPSDKILGFPLVYPIGGHDQQLRELINSWIRLNKAGGETDRIFDQWILGKVEKPTDRRWCILRDVLGWVD